FTHPCTVPLHMRVCIPKNQQGGHNQGAPEISQPPCQPDDSVVGPVCQAFQTQDSHADCSTDSCTDQTGKNHEFENIVRPIKGVPAIGQTGNQKRAYKPFKGVPDRDANCCD